MIPTVGSYSQDAFPFAQLVTEIIGEDLDALEERGPVNTRATDQGSRYHKLFYEHFDQIAQTYGAFVQRFGRYIVRADYYHQRVPTFRVHLPENLAVGEFHRDRDYGHPARELTVWLPLTEAKDSSAVWVEDMFGHMQPLPASRPGQFIVFDSANQLHGNVLNTTGKSRVSIDFRLLAKEDFPDEVTYSMNTRLPFVPGGYYA